MSCVSRASRYACQGVSSSSTSLCINYEKKILIPLQVYEFVKFGFLFAAKAVITSSPASEGRMTTQKNIILRTLPSSLVRRPERHVEQSTLVLNPSDKLRSYAKPPCTHTHEHLENQSSGKPGPNGEKK